MLHEFLLGLAGGATLFADKHRVNVAQPKERDMLTTVAAHHITASATVMLWQRERREGGREREREREREEGSSDYVLKLAKNFDFYCEFVL